jgi:hypothetical protein
MADEADEASALWAMADLATPMAVRVAATLRIADHIARGARTAPELAAAAGAHADTLDRVLRHLGAVGVLCRDESGRYALTARGETLCSDHPHQLRARLDIDGALGRADLSFVQLLHTVRTGEPCYPAQYGRSFWEDLSTDASRGASFDVLMGSDIAAEAPDIVPAYDWESLGWVVDVGGGNGTLLIALLNAWPLLRGTVVELAGPAAGARRRLAATGLNARADVMPGSFFDPLPPGGGGYVLSAVLHNWNDEPARRILQRCAEAAGTHGAIFVIERIRPDGSTWSSTRDLQGLAYFGGRERSLTELTALAAACGLRVDSVHAAGVNSIVKLVVG